MSYMLAAHVVPFGSLSEVTRPGRHAAGVLPTRKTIQIAISHYCTPRGLVVPCHVV